MSDYTPSTDEVRGAWIALTYNNTPEEFDRWLAEHDREVIQGFINQQVEYVRQSITIGEHSWHCDDEGCLGCECDPECDEVNNG